MIDKKPNLSVEINGIDMVTPLVLASGCCGYATELNEIEGFSWDFVGAVVLKSLSLNPRLGKAAPRIAETPAGMLNAIGLQNAGVDEFVKTTVPRLMSVPSPIVVSIIGETVDEYWQVAERLADCDVFVALEVNVSSPNIERGGIEFGIDTSMVAEVTAAVRRVWTKPLWMKLSPHATDIKSVAEACESEGADAVALINTLPAMAIDVSVCPPRPVLGENFGGLSGPAIKPVAVRKVFEVAKQFKARERRAAVIGMGGVWDEMDVLEFMVAGASCVQLGTVLFSNPNAAAEIARGLASHMAKMADESGDDLWLDVNYWTNSIQLR